MVQADGTGTDESHIWYRLDRLDCIIGVGGCWDEVATSGGGPGVIGERVVGSRIYDHVSGHFTRKFLKEFLARARSSLVLTRQSYRCDTPHAKRLMEMRAEVESPDFLRVTHQTLDVQALPFPVHVRQAPRAEARRLRCSICNRLRPKGRPAWCEPEEIARPGETSLVVHTVCPDCREQISLRRQHGVFSRVHVDGS